MAYVKVPKDLTKVKTKVALNMTKRQLVGFASAGIVGVPLYLGLRSIMPNDISMILMSIVVLPILFVTLYEKDNLPFEKYAKYIVRFHKRKKIRLYKAKSVYNTDKEVTIEKTRTKAKHKEKKTQKRQKRTC